MNNSLYSIISVSTLKGKTIKKEETRIALLISNLFNKLSSGYYKKNSLIAPAPAPATTPVKPVMPAPSIPNVINTAVASNPVVVGQDPIIPAKQVEETKSEKSFTEKTTPIDVIFLKSTRMHANSPAKKLLISRTFIQKLIGHRAKSINENKNNIPAPRMATIPKMVDPKDEAVKKYVDLMKKRKEAIAMKQGYEKEMTSLVNEFGITLDMVNAELAKRGEVA